ncbi:MAG: DUF456 domain-containing protein [Bacteroidia bacterium]|nr:DUF456 domain-containing protein [Bacteroidia bacterium]|tara:strand:- start:4687 stop:5196 length:510 start_codon:yes stop_codon:yes gene_type:complete
MELTIIIIGILLIITGFVGSIVPGIPGPPIAYLSLIILLLIDEPRVQLSTNNYFVLISIGIVTIILTVLDFYLPVWGTKKFGGTPSGTRGSTYGLVAAVILTILTSGFGVLLLIIGPFVGAYLGEKYAGNTDEVALKSGIGSFLGFISGTFIKLILVLVITLYFASLLI